MFRRRPKSKSSFLTLRSSNRGSDIVKPENTSLIVNESDTETDGILKELTSVLSEDEDDCIGNSDRKSSSLMRSLTQKTQSTPRSQSSSPKRILKEINNAINQNLSRGKSKTSQASPKTVKNRSQLEVKKKISYFEEVLRECGAQPLPGNSSYLMSEDQAVFSIKVNENLKKKDDNLKRFIASFQEEIENSLNLQKMLAHTLTAEDCEAARGPVQEPLMRMLLNVDCLQPQLLEILLEKLASIIIENEDETEENQIVSSIIRQLRFLNRINSNKIAPKLFEIIHVAPINIQREIIFTLPEIITEDEAEDVATQLVDMLRFAAMLTHVIVDSISNLVLSRETKSQVKVKVMNRLDKSPLEFLPSLVQFVLNRCESEDIVELVNGLRENLPFTIQHVEIRNTERTGVDDTKKTAEEDSYVKLTFENIKFSTMASKQMADIWIKVISDINSSKEFRCVDLIILIIFYSCLFGRKSQVLTILRNKIKSGVLTEDIVQDTFKILLVVAAEYFSAILELSSALLKSFEQAIADFGALIYKECFVHFHFYMKQTVMSEILLHIGTGTPATVTTALYILRSLCDFHRDALSQHLMSIMGLLIKIPDLDLMQVRLLLDVITSLVFSKSTESNIGCEDELQMYIRKQLASSNLEQAKKGIASAIMFGKHAGKEENGSDGDTQVNSVLELAMGSNGICDTKKGFFNDEFASVMKESKLRKSFLDYWKGKTCQIVMNNLFVRNIELTCEYFPMSLQYCVDTGDQNLVFPIVDFIIKSNTNKILNVPVSVIPSTLRLLWSLERNVTTILPVFCASVIMPEVTVFDKFNTFDTGQKKIILDCLFLCANYLIECVNALCSQKFLDKALIRVKQLIHVRKLAVAHLSQISDYTPPSCQFYTPPQKITLKKKNPDKVPKKGRKRKFDEEKRMDASESEALTPGPSFSAQAAAPMPKIADDVTDLHAYRGYFRELSHLTCSLLKADFKLNSRSSFNLNSNEEDDWSSVKSELNASDLLFLLEDLNWKSEQILKETKRAFNFKSKPTNLLVKDATPEDFISGSIKVLPKLLLKMERLSSYSRELLEANDGIYDGLGMYPKDSSDIKLALAAALKFVSEIISWPGFQNPNNKAFLEEILTVLSKKQKNENISWSATICESRALEAASYLSSFSSAVLIISGGRSIVKGFQACLRYSPSAPQTDLAELCLELLRRPWFTVNGVPERGAVYNQHVDFFLKTYFAAVNHKLEVVNETAKTALNELERLKEKDSVMESLKSINKSNFPLLYRMLCEALVLGATTEFCNTKQESQISLEIWNLVVETLLMLVETVKIHSSRVNLASLLKKSQSLIQLFLTKGMPVVESALRVKSVEVLKLLKAFQTATRFLHNICCHSKITSDSVVAAHVPNIRALCERLTLEVKGMLILNEIPLECITIAVLKNRDLKGNDIISQETVEEDSEDESELPSESSQNDQEVEKLIEEPEQQNHESYSEDY